MSTFAKTSSSRQTADCSSCVIISSIMAAETIQQQMEDFTISVPKVDLNKLKGIAEAMGWTLKKEDPKGEISLEDEEWTEEEEREAFLHTSRKNAAEIYAKYL